MDFLLTGNHAIPFSRTRVWRSRPNRLAPPRVELPLPSSRSSLLASLSLGRQTLGRHSLRHMDGCSDDTWSCQNRVIPAKEWPDSSKACGGSSIELVTSLRIILRAYILHMQRLSHAIFSRAAAASVYCSGSTSSDWSSAACSAWLVYSSPDPSSPSLTLRLSAL